MRLDKFLSNMGLGSRSEIRTSISRGYVFVNEEQVKKAGFNINEKKDEIKYNGKKINFVKHVYIMLNKPVDVISATEDKKHETVIDITREEYGNRKLFPVGRLDIDTEGMLIITDDGEFNHELMSPKKHVSKTYYAKIDGVVTKETVKSFKDGIVLSDGTICKPGILKIITESEIELSITEGKYHQVKRMFASVGMKVDYLKRISIGKLFLDESLELGEYRELTEEELELLKP